MPKEIIRIASDHAGFELKNEIKKFLAEDGYDVRDEGPFKYEPEDDYPDYAVKVCEKVLEANSKGILICGTGQGMDRAANKIPGIHAAVCWDENSARVAKEHGNVNVLCLGARVVGAELAKRMVKVWLEAKFIPEGKHLRRINKIKEIEKRYMKA